MTCEAVRDLLSLYIDGELDAETAAKVEQHLRNCSECGAEIEALRRTVDLCGALDEVEVPDGFRASLMQKVAASQNAEGAFVTAPAGFEKKEARRARAGLLTRLFGAGPRQAMAIAAAALVVIVGANSAMGTLSFGNPFSKSRDEALMTSAAPPAAPSPMGRGGESVGAAADSAQPQTLIAKSASSKSMIPDNSGTSYLDMTQVVERQIIKHASLQIETGKERFDEVSRQVVLAVESLGGFVQDSSVYTEGDGMRISNFSIRVPSDGFAKVLAQFETYGKVVNRSVGSQDVTDQYIDMEARLSNLEQQHTRLVELMGKAKTLDEILRVENELNRVRSEVDSYKGRLNYLKNAISMSSIQMILRENASSITPKPPSVWRDAWQALVRSFRAIVIFLGEAVPYLAAGWFLWFLVVTYKRK